MATPAMPNNLYVQTANGNVWCSWDLSAGADSYNVYRSTDNVTFSVLAASVTNSYLDSTATAGTQYFFKVTALTGTHESAATNAIGVVPVGAGKDTLGSLRLQAQQRADRVGSNFVTLPEWNTYLNQSYFELYDLLKNTYEDWFFATPYTVVTDGVNNMLDLPSDFYNLLGVDLGLASSTDAWVTLSRFEFMERNRYVFPNITSTFFGVFNMRYRLVGNKLMLIPLPGAGQSIKMWYIPRLTPLLKDTDIIDAVSGWQEYIVVDAAIKALTKEESWEAVNALLTTKATLVKRIEESAQNRDAGQPASITNSRSWGARNGNYGGTGWDGGFGGY